MGELVDAIASWPTFFAVLFVFGFAPAAVLRLILLAYHREDPRRRELRAELHVVPRWERPIWVCEQLEEAIFDGLGGRLRWAATGRIIDRWHLGSGVRRHLEHPDTFWIPDEEEKAAVIPGISVKLMFEMKGWGERMWVTVMEVKKKHIIGVLDNDPLGIPRLPPGDRIKFKREHIIDIHWVDEPPPQTIEGDVIERVEETEAGQSRPELAAGGAYSTGSLPEGVDGYCRDCHGRQGRLQQGERDQD